MSQPYDLIIVGAGVVGATLAAALATDNPSLTIAVIQSQQPQLSGDDIDLRVYAITQASQRILSAIQVWQRLPPARLSPFRDMHVWDNYGQIHFDSAELGEPQLGWIIENDRLQLALWQQLQALDNIELLCPASLADLNQEDNHTIATLDDGQKIAAGLIVGADGANSKVRQLANIDTGGWDYAQQGIVATVSHQKSHRETAWQRFLSTGPLAFLPLFDGRSSIVWSTNDQHAEQLLNLDDELFAEQLSEHFAEQLGLITQVSRRAAFPLRLQYAHNYVKPGIALIGDAAHVVHPLAGQGANLGLLDAAALAQILLQAKPDQLGLLKTLRRYERWRKSDNLLMLAALDGLKRLFDTQLPPVPQLRGLGLNLTNHAGLIKQLFARQAMGLSGDLPDLALAKNQYTV